MEADVQAKFNVLETQVRSALNRPFKTILNRNSFTILSTYQNIVTEDGIVYNCLMPCSGKLTRFQLVIDQKFGEEDAVFTVQLKGSKGSNKIKYAFKPLTYSSKLDIPVNEGDKLTISALNNVSGVWISILYEIDPKYLMRSEVPSDAAV